MGETLKGWFGFIASLLFDERGEVGELETEVEELETSEEAEDTGESEVETLESEDTAETDEALKPSDDETPPKDVPYPRFKEVNEKAQQADMFKTKLDQFKRLGADAYYKLYPDEKPEETPAPTKTDDPVDALIYENPGDQYHGMKFAEIFAKDPREAYRIDPYYARILHDRQIDSDRAKRTAEQRLLEESQAEIDSFSNSVAMEMFGKSEGLVPEQLKKISDTIQDTLDWMKQTGRGFGKISDAYILKNIDSIKKGTADKTLQGIVKALTSDAAPSISTQKTVPTNSGYGQFLSMDARQVAAEMEKWSDDDQEKFLKTAPKEIREKFPKLPWESPKK